MAGMIASPKRARSERVVELVIGNMSGWILQDVGSVARPWEHPLFWGGDGPPLLPPPPPPTSASDDRARLEAGIKLSFILAGTLTLSTDRKLSRVPVSLRFSPILASAACLSSPVIVPTSRPNLRLRPFNPPILRDSLNDAAHFSKILFIDHDRRVKRSRKNGGNG